MLLRFDSHQLCGICGVSQLVLYSIHTGCITSQPMPSSVCLGPYSYLFIYLFMFKMGADTSLSVWRNTEKLRSPGLKDGCKSFLSKHCWIFTTASHLWKLGRAILQMTTRGCSQSESTTNGPMLNDLTTL